MNNIKIGDKVKTTSKALRRFCGVVVALHKETIHGHSASASVYCGGYESVKIPLSDLIVLK
jgi:hypothetical protein